MKWRKDRIIWHGWNIEVEKSAEVLLKDQKAIDRDKIGELNSAIAREILRKADRFPLLSIIIQVKPGDMEQSENVVNLLKQVCRISVKQVSGKLTKGKSPEKIADELDEDIEQIAQICAVAKTCGNVSDVDKIYAAISKKA